MTLNRWKIVVAVLVVSATAIACLLILLGRRNEPSYKGRSLNEWLVSYLQATNPAQAEAAKVAVRSIGTNALPFLVNWVGYQSSDTDHQVADLRRSGSDKLNIPWLRGNNWQDRRHQAFLGFWILGEDAEPAVPDLRTLLERNGYEAEYTSRYAKGCIYAITNPGVVEIRFYLPPGHPDGTNILTPVPSTLTNTLIK